MGTWNAVAVARPGRYRAAVDNLSLYGTVERTEFYNVLLMDTPDMLALLEGMRETAGPEGLPYYLSRLVPVSVTFRFNSPEEFEARAREGAMRWTQQLRGRRFHVRMHRRGFRGRISSQEEEHILDDMLLEATSGSGAAIDYESPEAVLVVETVGQWAGMALYKAEDLRHYPFIRLEN